jgi:hypothetical protein
LIFTFESGKEFAKPPDTASVNGRGTQTALLPGGLQALNIGRLTCRLPLRVSDLEQIAAVGTTEVWSRGVAQIAASDATETKCNPAHARL